MDQKPSRTWLPTSVQNLQKNAKSGIYYGRIYSGGKETLKSLGTKTLSVAKARLTTLKAQAAGRSTAASTMDSDLTLRQAATIVRDRVEKDLRTKPRTKKYYLECLEALSKSWPDFDQELRKVTESQCRDWASSYAKKASATRFNNTLSQLKAVLTVGVDEGLIFSNPCSKVGRVSQKSKKLNLPSSEEFARLVIEMQTAHGRESLACAELVQFLAYSGCRLGEAGNVRWGDCDFIKGVLTVRGDDDTLTKNGEIRQVPMNPKLRQHLETMRSTRQDEGPKHHVLRVKHCYESLRRACALVGIKSLTHHDLRHWFATRCIEAGVDIPTVARWLGHKDGGALAMRVYGHLRQEHSLEQAKKVVF